MLGAPTEYQELRYLWMLFGMLILFILCSLLIFFLLVKKLQHDKFLQRKTIDALNEEICLLKNKPQTVLSVPSPIPKDKLMLSRI